MSIPRTSDLTVGEKLRIERRRSKENQPTAAKRMGVPLHVYKAMEADKQDAKAPALGKLTEPEAYFIMRRRTGWTMQAIAEDMGICKWWLQRMERGDAPIGTLRAYWEGVEVVAD